MCCPGQKGFIGSRDITCSLLEQLWRKKSYVKLSWRVITVKIIINFNWSCKITFLRLKIKSPSDLVMDRIGFFSKDEQGWIVFSIIFDCNHSDLAQEPKTPLIGSFWEKLYSKGQLLIIILLFLIKEQFWNRFFPWRKMIRFCINVLGGQDSSVR